jgi:hypothetical protein
MGILDPDSGEYTDTGKGVHPVFQGSIIDPDNLPKKKVDPYASVEHRDFTQVNTMGVKEMIQMGAIAESRGDSTTAMRWKTLANDLIIREEVRTDQSTAARQTTNNYVGPPGQGIVEPSDGTPWGADQSYRDLQSQIVKATSKEG